MILLMPLLILAGGAVLVMIAIAVRRNHRLAFSLALATFALGFVSLLFPAPAGLRQVTSLLVMDAYSRFYIGLLCASGFAAALMSCSYLERQSVEREEYYLLLLLATVGSAVLVASIHLASFLLGLEILSVCLYSLAGYTHTRERSIEAAVKYLVLAAVSAAILFFGMALLYADLGTMELPRMIALFEGSTAGVDLLLAGGIALTIAGIGFKLAVVPFHMWTPDIYEGAPAPASAFFASVSKGGMFALLLRYFAQLRLPDHGAVFATFAAIAVASMIVGNVLAVRQENLKRLLAYSSIANWGYALVAFLAGGPRALTAAAYFVAAYFGGVLCAFGVVTALSSQEKEAENISDYRGLFRRRPWLASILTVALLSLASIPITGGFIAKLFVLAAGINSAMWVLVLVLIGSSGIGLYYYLRVVMIMMREPDAAAGVSLSVTTLSGGLVLAALAMVLIFLGLYPDPVIRLIETTAAIL